MSSSRKYLLVETRFSEIPFRTSSFRSGTVTVPGTRLPDPAFRQITPDALLSEYEKRSCNVKLKREVGEKALSEEAGIAGAFCDLDLHSRRRSQVSAPHRKTRPSLHQGGPKLPNQTPNNH
jgi:hypothetical protein